MNLLDLTLETPAENLALDEALLAELDEFDTGGETLRLWEPPQPFVVLGRSSPMATEVDLAFCRARQIPVLRRASGGATVVTGPGCLMYGLTLDLRRRPELAAIDAVHHFVLGRIVQALKQLEIRTDLAGTSDLTLGSGLQKFSGNSLRICRNAVLYHGTLLNGLSVELIQQCLRRPVRQPDYRNDRTHQEFLSGLNVDTGKLKAALVEAWGAKVAANNGPFPDGLRNRVSELVRTKYGSRLWTEKIV